MPVLENKIIKKVTQIEWEEQAFRLMKIIIKIEQNNLKLLSQYIKLIIKLKKKG